MRDFLTEDQVRDKAWELLGMKDVKGAVSGTGQLTTFNQLGFPGISDKPDGWILPEKTSEPALILETKNSDIDIYGDVPTKELLKNIRICKEKYDKVVGILWNGYEQRVFKGEEEQELTGLNSLENAGFYFARLFPKKEALSVSEVFGLTYQINNTLHFSFGIKDLYKRMIFTACALVAESYNANLGGLQGQPFATIKASITAVLNRELHGDYSKKFSVLIEEFENIVFGFEENQEAIDSLIGAIVSLSKIINESLWQGEDIMAIFFNEFNRYKSKSEYGQVLTPEHIIDLIYDILDVGVDDHVLDAACGSGSFLVKSMARMCIASGGFTTQKAEQIKSEQLFGIEFDKQIYALACANMLLHRDGKTNLLLGDTRTKEAGQWMAENHITKVLMNPPYENRYGCMDIVESVLDNVEPGCESAFILPDRKLVNASKNFIPRLLKKHRLKQIIKLPEDLFFGVGVKTSIFIFEAGVPQNSNEVFTYYIEDDGFETRKNQGRADRSGRWSKIRENVLKDVKRQQNGMWIDPEKDELCYAVPEEKMGVDEVLSLTCEKLFSRALEERYVDITPQTLVHSAFSSSKPVVIPSMEHIATKVKAQQYKEFPFIKEFATEFVRGRAYPKRLWKPGNMPVITASKFNNGVQDYIEGQDTLVYSDAITISCFGNSFYQEGEFVTTSTANVANLKETVPVVLAKFMSAQIDSVESLKYSYEKTLVISDADNITVTLPVKEDGGELVPDVEFIKEVMKEINESADMVAEQLC